MNIDDIIWKRKSVRDFKNQDVSNDLLDVLVSVAKKGPSAGGIRGYQAIVTRERIAYNAPVCVVICIDQDRYVKRYGDRGHDLYSIQDAAIFGAYLQLLLVDRGLSSVWVGAFNEDKIRAALGTVLRPVAIIAIGYAANE